MFELNIDNIEDIMANLEGLTIQEKVQELEDLCPELEDDTLEEEVQKAKESLIDDYKKSITNPLNASVSALINQKHWEDLVTIKKLQLDDYFIVNSKPTNVLISAHWNLDDHWAIWINLSPFISNVTKRFETYANLA